MSRPAAHAIVLHAGAKEAYPSNDGYEDDICLALRQLAVEAAGRLQSGAKAIEIVTHVTEVLRSSLYSTVNETEVETGTVGAIALDSEGNLAAANLSGNILARRAGRIPDASVRGVGIYADPTLAVVCSGNGEDFRSSVGETVASGFRGGQTVESAAKHAFQNAAQNAISSSGGIIALTLRGEAVTISNSRTFAVASAGSDIPTQASILPTSLTHLSQLIFYEDDYVTVSFAKYPTMPGQAIMELKNDKHLVSLDLGPFRQVWGALILIETVLKASLNFVQCSCAVLGGRIHIFPYSRSDNPSSTFSGASYNNNRHSSSVPPWQDAWTQLVQSVAVSLSENIERPENVQVNIDFDGTNIGNIEAQSNQYNLQSHPHPAKFHNTYPGYMSVEAGPRAADLEDLPRKARLVADTINSVSKSIPAAEQLLAARLRGGRT